jgi:hypothetical protein
MGTWIWIIVAIAIVIIAALILMAIFDRQRTTRLRRQFGDEYDRTVRAKESRRSAEAELRGRERQRAEFQIMPLPEQARARFAAEWRDIQQRFVDEPSNAVVAADGLVYRVMGARGYPMEDFEAQANLVSVDHPRVVENYRHAHNVYDRARSHRATTEDLRAALLHYRALFDELLQANDGAAAESSPSARYPQQNSAVDGHDARHEGRHAANGNAAQPGYEGQPTEQGRR